MNTRRYSKLQRAFTLVEILVVVIIIGILASLIVPNVLKHVAESKITAAKSDISTLKGALQAYHLASDAYPTTEQGLNALVTQPSDVSNWKGAYIEKIPNDPWGNPYHYESPGPTGQDYLITSYGSDGKVGGEGDAADITSDQ
jgi:general secretion pathway protein G